MGRAPRWLLLSKGASDFLVDRRGLSPLHLAVLSMKADMVFVLCQNHVSQASLIDMPASRDGSTALHLAMRVGNQKAAKILLAQGASVELLDKDGATPLHRLVMQEDRGSASMVRELQVAGADVNVRSSNGESPLHLAAVSGNALAVKALLDIGADIDARTGSVASQPGSDEELVAGMTPLSLAVQYGKVAVVRVLLSRGASTSVASDAGASPLHLAAAVGGSPEVAQLLLESEAQIDARNDKGQTALHVAAAYGSENVLQILVARDAALGTGLLEAVSRKGHTPLHEAATYGTVGAARLLSQTGLALNATAKDGTTAFLRAVIEGHEDIVLQLIEAGSCVYARADGPLELSNLTMLDFATLAERTSMLRTLFRHAFSDGDDRGPLVIGALRIAARFGKERMLNAICELDLASCQQFAAEQQLEEEEQGERDAHVLRIGPSGDHKHAPGPTEHGHENAHGESAERSKDEL